ncbi:hypothetical protein SUDANB105_07501 [Streptomyces sp. enrichment culture]|uniref:hypothetical protein n=1 Tax=Streptomyces sp. enrichment culture TaxID=1795815 RepID=UPI003F55B451
MPQRGSRQIFNLARRFLPLAMSRWGDRWLADEAGPPIAHYHDVCGQESHAEVVCAACGEPMTAENTHPRMGPGYPPHLAERPEVRERFPG